MTKMMRTFLWICNGAAVVGKCSPALTLPKAFRLLARTLKSIVAAYVCTMALSGCATFKTLDTDLPLNQRMFVYSGTRLDWPAITDNQVALKKIKVTPPRYPAIDLPFSFALDTLFFPLAVCAEIFH